MKKEEKSMTKINFYGIPSYDYILYLAQLFTKANKRVGIKDCSSDKSLFYTVDEGKAGNDFYGINIMEEEPEQNYDITITYYGMDEGTKEEITYAFYVSNLELQNLYQIKHLIRKNEEFRVIIRDNTGGSNKDAFIQELLDINKSELLVMMEDTADSYARVQLQYNYTGSFRNVCPECENYIFELGRAVLSDMSDKEYMRLFRLVQKGEKKKKKKGIFK